jgi:simple sugar transport system permease protein
MNELALKKRGSAEDFVRDNLVALIFLSLSLAALPFSGQEGAIVSNLMARVARNAFLVFALIIPIYAGMGINFSMTLGAMAGQIGLVFAVDWNVIGAWGLLFAAIIGTPIAILFGFGAGSILNKCKGREMVTSLILGFFMEGVYQLIVLYAFGSVIPMRSPNIELSRGYGVRNILNLETVRGSLDDLVAIKIPTFKLGNVVFTQVTIPIVTIAIIAALALFILWFKRTKLGQDMKAVGNDLAVAKAAGINPDRTRIVSIVISTVLACYGQIIFLQSINNMMTTDAQSQTGFMAAAAILVGGATASKASIKNVLVGVALLHFMFETVPNAAPRLIDQANVAEYLRSFLSYGVIALALVLHAYREKRKEAMARDAERRLAGATSARHAAEKAAGGGA